MRWIKRYYYYYYDILLDPVIQYKNMSHTLIIVQKLIRLFLWIYMLNFVPFGSLSVGAFRPHAYIIFSDPGPHTPRPMSPQFLQIAKDEKGWI